MSDEVPTPVAPNELVKIPEWLQKIGEFCKARNKAGVVSTSDYHLRKMINEYIQLLVAFTDLCEDKDDGIYLVIEHHYLESSHGREFYQHVLHAARTFEVADHIASVLTNNKDKPNHVWWCVEKWQGQKKIEITEYPKPGGPANLTGETNDDEPGLSLPTMEFP